MTVAATTKIRDTQDDDWRTLDEPSIAAAHRAWLDRGLPSSTWADYVKQRQATCAHRSTMEIGMIEGDAYGCKVVRCDGCGVELNSHRSIYGCPRGI